MNDFMPLTVEAPKRSVSKKAMATHAMTALFTGLAVFVCVQVMAPAPMPAMQADAGEPLALAYAKDLARYTPAVLPIKYSVDHSVPSVNQMHRGTCWDFATTGLIEHHYRMRGIEKGLLKHDEYVQFSEQAFGISVVHLCDKHHGACTKFGTIAYKSVDGGDVGVLGVFAKGLTNQILPVKVCPYTELKDQFECPNMEAAIAENPIKMRVKSVETFYDVESTKKALVEAKGYAMTFSVPWLNTASWLPCEGAMAKDAQCAPLENGDCQHWCPPALMFRTSCCKKVTMPIYNGDGEFYEHHAMDMVSGHLMLLVGYSDTFITEEGDVGGFILRNSWGPTGSHSIKWWKREISEADERVYCPNHNNPRNWAICAKEDYGTDVNFCMGEQFKETVNDLGTTIELKCVDEAVCNTDPAFEYVATNSTQQPGTMLRTMCFHEFENRNYTGHTFCSTPVPGGNLVKHAPSIPLLGLMQPKHPRENHADVCGHYFFPYTLVEKIMTKLGNYQSTRVVMDFDDESYARGHEDDKRYDLIRASTGRQLSAKFKSPYWDTDLKPKHSFDI